MMLKKAALHGQPFIMRMSLFLVIELIEEFRDERDLADDRQLLVFTAGGVDYADDGEHKEQDTT